MEPVDILDYFFTSLPYMGFEELLETLFVFEQVEFVFSNITLKGGFLIILSEQC
jgi:hypothetical protein